MGVMFYIGWVAVAFGGLGMFFGSPTAVRIFGRRIETMALPGLLCAAFGVVLMVAGLLRHTA